MVNVCNVMYRGIRMDSSFEDVLERIETGDDHEIEQIMDAVH